MGKMLSLALVLSRPKSRATSGLTSLSISSTTASNLPVDSLRLRKFEGEGEVSSNPPSYSLVLIST